MSTEQKQWQYAPKDLCTKKMHKSPGHDDNVTLMSVSRDKGNLRALPKGTIVTHELLQNRTNMTLNSPCSHDNDIYGEIYASSCIYL